ncbi:MAG: LytTR family DNA-binding domain-containing protein, partial [Clostridia bacterium]|nr:LytTR family DNA-binding domain-containing protein [Clostridia bacterium]
MSQLRIAICDDSEQWLQRSSEMLRHYAALHPEQEIEAVCFNSALEMLTQVEMGERFHIYLLDVVMPGISGIEVARQLRNLCVGVSIIFLTSETAYALEAFEVGATQYLIKGIPEERLFEVLDNAGRLIGRERRRQIIFNTRTGMRNLYVRNIMYAASDGKLQILTLDSGERLEVRMTHKELEAELERSTNFKGIGSSYIVNLFYISAMTAESV